MGTAAAVGLSIALPGTIGAFVSGLGHPDLPLFSFGYVNLLAFAGFLTFNAVNMLITAFH